MVDFLVLLIHVGFAIACAVVANGEKRSVVGWFILGFFFSIFALILLLVLDRSPRRLSAHAAFEARGTPIPGLTRICPDCAEIVQATARICRYCRHEFPALENRRAEAWRRLAAPPNRPVSAQRHSYAGVDCTVQTDGSVEAILDEEQRAWDSFEEFRRDIVRSRASRQGHRRFPI